MQKQGSYFGTLLMMAWSFVESEPFADNHTFP